MDRRVTYNQMMRYELITVTLYYHLDCMKCQALINNWSPKLKQGDYELVISEPEAPLIVLV